MNEDKLKIAVFIDFDNIQIGVRSTLNRDFDLALVLEALKERGEVVTKIAYGNWKRAGELTRTLTHNAVLMVQRDLTPRGDKNGADINLALDALEMAINHPHINAFVVVGGDSDFIALVEKLKQYNKAVFVVGGRSFTSSVLQRNCREFIAYENLVEDRPSGDRRRDEGVRRRDLFPLTRAVPLVYRGLKVLADREVQAQLGLLKSTLIQLDSTFNERDFGASSFRSFIQKMADAQLLTVRQQGNSYVVEPLEREPFVVGEATEANAEGGEAGSERGDRIEQTRMDPSRMDPQRGDRPERNERLPDRLPGERLVGDRGGERGGEGGANSDGSGGRAGADEGASIHDEGESEGGTPAAQARPAYASSATVAQRPPEEALELLQRILAPLRGTNPRPLYLRNVKQMLRAESANFDEQQYGFASIVDLLRAGQSQNWLRLQRDRRGALRVFIPGTGTGPVAGASASPEVGGEGERSDFNTAAPAPRAAKAELDDDERQPAFLADPPAPPPPPPASTSEEDSQIAVLGYYDGIHGEQGDSSQLSLAAAVADSAGRKKRPRKPKSEGGPPPRRRKTPPKR